MLLDGSVEMSSPGFSTRDAPSECFGFLESVSSDLKFLSGVQNEKKIMEIVLINALVSILVQSLDLSISLSNHFLYFYFFPKVFNF